MDQFILPSTFRWEVSDRPNTATVYIEPCYFGYGTTLGNALRRVLLSSLEGAAVTAVKIAGVTHEFTAAQHVQEDVIELLMNLKQLRLKIFSAEPVHLMLRAMGKREVTGRDVTPQADVEIVNPDLHLATLTDDDAALEMEITAQRGRGYVTVDGRGKERSPLGTMAIDAVYTPVQNVGFRVENMRVGDITNYDRLILTVETDGTMTPRDAVERAAKILIDHFALLTSPPEATAAVPGDDQPAPATIVEDGEAAGDDESKE